MQKEAELDQAGLDHQLKSRRLCEIITLELTSPPQPLRPDANLNCEVDLDLVLHHILANLEDFNVALPYGLWNSLARAVVYAVDDTPNSKLVKLSLIINASKSPHDIILWIDTITKVVAHDQYLVLPNTTVKIINTNIFSECFQPYLDMQYAVIPVELPIQNGPVTLEGWVCLNYTIAVSDSFTAPKSIVDHFALANIINHERQQEMMRDKDFNFQTTPDLNLNIGFGFEKRVWKGERPCWTRPADRTFAELLAKRLFDQITSNNVFTLTPEDMGRLRRLVGVYRLHIRPEPTTGYAVPNLGTR